MKKIREKSINKKNIIILGFFGAVIILTCVLNLSALGVIAEFNQSICQHFADYKAAYDSGDSQTILEVEEQIAYTMTHSNTRINGTFVFNIVLFGLLSSIIVTTYLTLNRLITMPVQIVNDKIKYIADGDLTTHFDLENQSKDVEDEVILMQINMNEMVDKLKGIVTNVIGVSEDVSGTAKELDEFSETISVSCNDITCAVQEIANGSTQVAQDMQIATENMNTMYENIQSIDSSTNDLVSSADNMESTKNIVLETLNELNDVTYNLVNDISDTNAQITKTNNDVILIKDAIELIKDLADQTHLLSLNASIEASRHGNGAFNVISSEVRSLAESSKRVADKIAVDLGELGKNYGLIIEKINISTNSVNDQVKKINDTKDKFLSLDNDIKNTSKHIEKINVTVEELSNIKDIISDIIINLSAITEENSAATEETLSSMELLNDITIRIKEKAFDLNGKTDILQKKMEYFNIE